MKRCKEIAKKYRNAKPISPETSLDEQFERESFANSPVDHQQMLLNNGLRAAHLSSVNNINPHSQLQFVQEQLMLNNQLPAHCGPLIKQSNLYHFVKEEPMDDELSEDEQPLDFSFKSRQSQGKNGAKFKHTVDSTCNLTNVNKFEPSLFSMHSNHGKTGTLPFIASDAYHSFKHNAFYGRGQAIFNQNLLPVESPTSLHSEPSSPEGLSSASSTSSSSSLGYYSGSSLYNFPMSVSYGSNCQPPPPPYSSLQLNKQTLFKQQQTSLQPQQQVRPSVIVAANKSKPTDTSFRETIDLPIKKSYSLQNGNLQRNSFQQSVIDPVDPLIDEHFRRSLGSSYSEVYNANSVELKTELRTERSYTITKSNAKVTDHFAKSLGEKSSTIIQSATSVDDHFAKALGDTWFKLKKDSVVS